MVSQRGSGQWPFVWILLIPAVTVPWQWSLALDMLNDECVVVGAQGHEFLGTISTTYECPAEAALVILLPGLLNLLAFARVWIPGGHRKVALMAGTLGAVRLVAPALLYMAAGADVHVTEEWLDFTPLMAKVGGLGGLSVMLWFASLAAFVWGRPGAHGPSAPPPSRSSTQLGASPPRHPSGRTTEPS